MRILCFSLEWLNLVLPNNSILNVMATASIVVLYGSLYDSTTLTNIELKHAHLNTTLPCDLCQAPRSKGGQFFTIS